jgi:hypothetical protein
MPEYDFDQVVAAAQSAVISLHRLMVSHGLAFQADGYMERDPAWPVPVRDAHQEWVTQLGHVAEALAGEDGIAPGTPLGDEDRYALTKRAHDLVIGYARRVLPDYDHGQAVTDLSQAVRNAWSRRLHLLDLLFPTSAFFKAPSIQYFNGWPGPTKLAYWSWLRGIDEVAGVLAVMDGIPPGDRFTQLGTIYREDLIRRAYALVFD